ncbi:MAG TPA: HepT-like ribonuclease domain-containing protein [Mucilaginibacter sp.]
MQREIKKYLFDIQGCIENIENFIGGSKVFSNFDQNIMVQQAVERNLEIIGEAVNNLLKIYPEIKITDARRMVDARNKIIHSYDEIQPIQIWNIIINHLPLLKQEVQLLLEN